MRAEYIGAGVGVLYLVALMLAARCDAGDVAVDQAVEECSSTFTCHPLLSTVWVCLEERSCRWECR